MPIDPYGVYLQEEEEEEEVESQQYDQLSKIPDSIIVVTTCSTAEESQMTPLEEMEPKYYAELKKLGEADDEELPGKRRSFFDRLFLVTSIFCIALLLLSIALIVQGVTEQQHSPSSEQTTSSNGTEPTPYPGPATSVPTLVPAKNEEPSPTASPVKSTESPSTNVEKPVEATSAPSAKPTEKPSKPPTLRPSTAPTKAPTSSPTTRCPVYPTEQLFEGKKGACFTQRPQGQIGSWTTSIPRMIQLKPYWNYNWGMSTVDAQPDDIEFVPMVWSGKNLSGVKYRINSTLSQQPLPSTILGFNEPDQAKQSNMTVEQAVLAWRVMQKSGLPLVSPSCAQPLGDWMQSFMQVVDEKCLRIDYVGVHWYGGSSVDAFKSQMQNVYQQYQRPLLLTEFAPADWTATSVSDNQLTRSGVLSFMKQVLPWLEATDWIVGYAWFSFSDTSPYGAHSALFDSTGNLTVLGEFYASVSTDNPEGDQSITI